MNENLNLVEILKDCPEGTKLYSPIYGDIELVNVSQSKDEIYPIRVKLNENASESFTEDGRLDSEFSGECMLFPSREQRDWSKFKPKQPKFDPKTLCPFDRVLVRDRDVECWRCGIFSHIINECVPFEYHCIGSVYEYCIPYNEDTKHLVGTTKEAPEYYRYWED